MGRRAGNRRNRGVQSADNSVEIQDRAGLGHGPGQGHEGTTTASSAERLRGVARVRQGVCQRGVCGREAACKQVAGVAGSGAPSYTCICPHDDSPPTEPGMRCPNRSTVPHTPSPIHNIIPPTTNISSPLPAAAAAPAPPPRPLPPAPQLVASLGSAPGRAAAPNPSPMLTLAMGGGLVFVVAVVVVLSLLCWVCRKAKHARKQQAPRSLSKGPLGSEHFLPNPQYSVAMAGTGQLPGLLSGLPGSPGGSSAPAVDLLPRRALTLLHDLGEGCFGKVYKGRLELRADQGGGVETVAVKVLKESATREAEEDFMREVKVMSSFRSPHILRLIGVVPRDATSPPCMVFEYMPYGDLTEVLRSSSRTMWEPRATLSGLPPLTQETLVGIALQIAKGMLYLASQRFVHRDLACRNCLVGHNLIVKIADFGMSRDVYTCDYYKVGGSRLMPVRWMSPEALMYGRFTLESDVWSFGVVLWEVLTRGKQPYFGNSNEEVVKLIMRHVLLQPPEDCPTIAADVMRCCWKTEPRERPRFGMICTRLEEAKAALALAQEAHQDSLALPKTLPRPPALPTQLSQLSLPDDLPEPEELLDSDNYLLPRVPTPSRCQYMQPLPD